tara:strand:- start:17246 stop:17419 length:174 start_codon:yes stop_codon:yes gene_type:complete
VLGLEECKGKREYESEGIALVSIDELKANGNEYAEFLSTYQCEWCKYWYLTSRNYKN